MGKKPSDMSLSKAYNRSPSDRIPTPKPDPDGLPLRVFVILLLAVMVMGAIVSGTVMVVMMDDYNLDYTPPTGEATSEPPIITDGDANKTELYTETIPSVVSVYAIDGEGSYTSQGSGFVYDDDGHILTNDHVIQGGETFYVQYSNGDWARADLVGADAYTDVAVLDPEERPDDAEPLPTTDRIPEPGEQVIAIGSPHDLGGTVTSGIVSGTERSMQSPSGFTIPDTIQSDAALNPGNSGGPLIASNGEVLGLNRAEQGENIGFAVSMRLTERVAHGLIVEGEYNHPYVGIRSIGLDPHLADEYGVEFTRGVLVTEVMEGTPADGILKGGFDDVSEIEPDGGDEDVEEFDEMPSDADIIVAIDGNEIRNNEAMSSYLMRMKSPGEEVEFTVLRDGERKTVTVELGERPAAGG